MLNGAHDSSGPSRFRRFFSQLGPGLITGAADDDPSGIATYSIAGAAFGYGLLWTALFSFPLTAVQLMCARLGMVTGRGLAAVVRSAIQGGPVGRVPLLTSPTQSTSQPISAAWGTPPTWSGVNALYCTPVWAGLIVVLLLKTPTGRWRGSSNGSPGTVRLCDHRISRAPGLAPRFCAPPSCRTMRWTREYLSVLVGILGTSISPYLFFWQAAEEVEEEKAGGRTTLAQRQGATDEELRAARNDVVRHVLLEPGDVLHHPDHGGHTARARHHANRNRPASRRSLRPLAGPGAYWLFTLGLIGTGMLGVPVLAGSSAYAIGEAMAWSASLDRRPSLAPKFYGVLVAAMAIGLGLDYAGLDAVRMLFWSAVAQRRAGAAVDRAGGPAHQRPQRHGRPRQPAAAALAWLVTAAVMGVAAIGMFAA